MNLIQKIKYILYGMFFFELEEGIRSILRSYENLLLFMLYSDMLGIPIISNYYALRLLPYIVSKIGRWKKDAVREIDIFEELSHFH